MHVEELNVDVDGSRLETSSINLGLPRRAWQFTSMGNERDRPSLSLPAAQTAVDAAGSVRLAGLAAGPAHRTARRSRPSCSRRSWPTASSPSGSTQLSEDSVFVRAGLGGRDAGRVRRSASIGRFSRGRRRPRSETLFVELLADGFDSRKTGAAPGPRPGWPTRDGVSWSNHLSSEVERNPPRPAEGSREGRPAHDAAHRRLARAGGGHGVDAGESVRSLCGFRRGRVPMNRRTKNQDDHTDVDRRDFLAATAATAASHGAARRAAPRPNEHAAARARPSIASSSGSAAGRGRSIRGTPSSWAIRKAKKAGSYYTAIDTAIPGVQVCEHLPQCAKLLDRFVLVRTVHHEVIDEHAAAVNRMHTGRPTSGTIVYPSIGSIVAHQRGAAGEGVPAYVLIGYPNVTRGPGFLGAKHGYVYLTDTESGPAGLSRPPEITAERQARREALLAKVREGYLTRQTRRRAGPAIRRDDRRGAAAGRAAVQADLRARPGAGQPPRRLRRRVRPAVPARPAGWSRRACGSSRSRTTSTSSTAPAGTSTTTAS